MKISVDCNEVYQGSVYLKQKGNDYGDLIKNLYDRIEQMQSVWKGVDHQQYQSQLEQFRPELMNLQEIILEYAKCLKQTANIYEQLQQDRVAQAKNLL